MLVAAPIGPVNILTVRRTLVHGRVIGLATGVGAALGDTILGAIAAFGFALPYSIWYWLLMRHRVDELTPFTLLMPVFGVITATWQLGEELSEGIVLGGGIILLGLAIVVWRGRPKTASIPPAQ